MHKYLLLSRLFMLVVVPAIGYGLYIALPPYTLLPPEGWWEALALVIAPFGLGFFLGTMKPKNGVYAALLAVSLPVIVDLPKLIIVAPIDITFLGIWILSVFLGAWGGKQLSGRISWRRRDITG